MALSNNLLYLLLLYAVLDKENRISTTTGLLVALGVMLYGTCRTAINACCNNTNPCNNTSTCSTNANPFQTINNIFWRKKSTDLSVLFICFIIFFYIQPIQDLHRLVRKCKQAKNPYLQRYQNICLHQTRTQVDYWGRLHCHQEI